MPPAASSRLGTAVAVCAVALAGAAVYDGFLRPRPTPSAAPHRDLATNGPVNAIAVAPDGTAYLGGNFTAIGPPTGHLVVLDATTGALAAPAQQLEATVSATAPDGHGGWYVGTFRQDPGGRRGSLVRIRADGTMDPTFATSVDGTVSAIAVGDGAVYLGGGFEGVGGEPRQRLAAVDATTGAVTPWNPARDPSAIPGLARGRLTALAVAGERIYAAGTHGPGWRSGWIAAVDPAGAVSAWSPRTDGAVRALAPRGDTLYAGGGFTEVDGVTRTGLAAFDPGGALSTWSVSAPDVQALASMDGTLFALSALPRVGDGPRAEIFVIDPSGAVTAWDPGIEKGPGAWTLAAADGTIYLGGGFESARGERRLNVAAFDASGALLPWNPAANSPVTSLAVSGGRVLAGGVFTSVGAVRRHHLAALDPAGHVTSWDPGVGDGGLDAAVFALEIVGDRIYVGGSFSSLGDAGRENLAALDRDGRVLDDTPSADDEVHALAAAGGAVYAGGTFSRFGGVRRAGLAAFAPGSGGAVLDFDPTLADTGRPRPDVRALATRDGAVHACGRFRSAGGVPREGCAAFDARGRLLPWNPALEGAPGHRAEIYALAATDRGIYLGGAFARVGAAPRAGIALVDATTGAPARWSATLTDAALAEWPRVRSILPLGDTVHVGGELAVRKGPGQPVTHATLATVRAGIGDATLRDLGPRGATYVIRSRAGRLLLGQKDGVASAP